jgi:hypothetical protein
MSSLDDTHTLGDLFDEPLQALPASRADKGSADIVDHVINRELPTLLTPYTKGYDVEVRGSTGAAAIAPRASD